MADSEDIKSSTPTVLILLFCLLGMIVLLFFLYKRLNRAANGEYTVRRMVYKEGGVRDRVRGAALALGTRLGVQLWPQSDADEDGEEMQEVQDEEGQVEEGGSQGSDSEGDDSEGDDQEEEEEEEQCGGAEGEGGDNSSLENSEEEEQDRLTVQAEDEGEMGEKVGNGEGTGEARGGAGLSIDLKQFSGSAIWSEEQGGMALDSDVTAL